MEFKTLPNVNAALQSFRFHRASVPQKHPTTHIKHFLKAYQRANGIEERKKTVTISAVNRQHSLCI